MDQSLATTCTPFGQFRNPDTILYNPVIPRVIFGIPLPAHTFNSEFAFKSRIPKNLLATATSRVNFSPYKHLGLPSQVNSVQSRQDNQSMRKSCWLGQKGQRFFSDINDGKTWHHLEGDGPNSSSHKQGLSGFTSGHDKSILPARGFPRWFRERKGVLFLIS